MAAQPNYQDLVDQGVAALEELQLVRFQAGHEDVGDMSKRSLRFAYVYRNKSQRQIQVVPLVPMSRRIHSNTTAMDQTGRRLVLLDSEYSRKVALRFVMRLKRTIHSSLEKVGNKPVEYLTTHALQDAFGSLSYTDKPYAERQAEVLESLEVVKEEAAAIHEQLNDSLQGPLGYSFSDEQRKYLLEARKAARKLLYMLDLRRDNYIPFVLLWDGLEGVDGNPSKQYTFLRHHLELVTSSDPLVARAPIATGLVGRIANPLYWLGYSVFRTLSRFLGADEYDLDFPLVPEARSYHIRVVPARGLALLPSLEPTNLKKDLFDEDNQQTQYLSASSSCVHAFRTDAQIQKYETAIREWADEFEKTTKTELRTSFRDRIWLKVRVKERPEIRLLFIAAVVFAGLAGAFAYDLTRLPGAAFITGSITTMVTLVAQSIERPFSQKLIAARIITIILVGFVVAAALPWLLTR